MWITAVAMRLRQQGVEVASGGRCEVETNDRRLRQAFPECGHNRCKRVFQHQHLGRCIGQDEFLLGNRKPPVQRHQDRAEPRAGVKQHEVVGAVQAEDRDAIAAANA